MWNCKGSFRTLTCAAWNQFMTKMVRPKPTVYPMNELVKYWLCFPLETSKRRANATNIPAQLVQSTKELWIGSVVMNSLQNKAITVLVCCIKMHKNDKTRHRQKEAVMRWLENPLLKMVLWNGFYCNPQTRNYRWMKALSFSTVKWRLYQVLQYPQGRALKMDVENLLLGTKAAWFETSNS